MSAAPSVTTLEENIVHIDEKLAVTRHKQTSTRDYLLKYLCAALSSARFTFWIVARVLTLGHSSYVCIRSNKPF